MNLFVEIKIENFPAKKLSDTLQKMELMFEEQLSKESIQFSSLKLEGTCRRFVLSVIGIEYSSEDEKLEITGPSESIAYKDGKLSNVGKAFIKSKDILEGTLKIKEVNGKRYICGLYNKKKMSISSLIEQTLINVIDKTKFNKSMTWNGITFLRPITNIISFIEDKFLEIKIGDISSNNKVEYMGDVETIGSYSEYFNFINRKNILLNLEDRDKSISNTIKGIEKNETYYEAINTVENPKVVLSSFDEKYLHLPPKLIEGAIDKYQMGLPIHSNNGDLTSTFYTICESGTDDLVVSKGNSYVINSRLEDADNFYKEDLTIKLEDRDLSEIVFQKNLGSMLDKVNRITNMCNEIEEELIEYIDVDKLIEASKISKNDLQTLLVKEKEYFSLRGYIGSIYAKEEGRSSEVQKIIYEHYLPKFDGDILPSTKESALLSIFDKMDNIVSAAILKRLPTGASDPMYIRRDAISILNIIDKFDLNIDLILLFTNSLNKYVDQNYCKNNLLELTDDYIAFMKSRCEQYLLKGYDKKLVNSTIEYWNNLIDIKKRLDAISSLSGKIIELAKRVHNISKKCNSFEEVQPFLFIKKEESNLFNKINELSSDSNYVNKIREIEQLSDVIETFFDNVIIIDEDKKIRKNRFNLIGLLLNKINSVAKISEIIF